VLNNKKLLYLLDEDISDESGVLNKIKAQINEWESYGNTVKVVSLRSNSFHSSLKNYEILSQYKRNGVFRALLNNYKCFSKLKKIVQKFKPDVIYTRQIKFSPNFLSSFGGKPYVIEINTDDFEEMKLGNPISFWLHKWTRRFMLCKANGAVFVTNELHHGANFRLKPQKSIVIPNGVSKSEVITPNLKRQKKIRLFLLEVLTLIGMELTKFFFWRKTY
jgi:hypothetical protein